MQRDMELIRKILFKIEEAYVDTWLGSDEVSVEGYDMKTIAYHCSILFDAGFVSDYKGQYGDGELLFFGVGRLTWEGHEFLDKIRSDTIWNRTKTTIISKGLPFVIEVVKEVATAVSTAMVQSAISSL